MIKMRVRISGGIRIRIRIKDLMALILYGNLGKEKG